MSNSSREELVSFQLPPGGVGFLPTPPGRSLQYLQLMFTIFQYTTEFTILRNFVIVFDLIYLRLDIIVICNISYLIAFELLYHLSICLYLYWYLPCYVQLLPGGVGFLPTPPGRS
jgi:hypothetical protein